MKNMIPFLWLCLLCFQQAEAQTYTEINQNIETTLQQGKMVDALRYAEQGKQKALAEYGNQDSIYGAYLHRMASLQNQLGQFKQSEALYLEAQSVYSQSIGKENRTYAEFLFQWAGLYAHLQQWEKAEAFYIEAKSLKERLFGKTDPSYGKTLIDIAHFYQKKGDYAAAEPFFVEGVERVRQAMGETHLYYAFSLEYLAFFYKEIGRYDAAEPLYTQSIAIQKKNNNTRHPIYAGTLNNLSALYLELGRLDQALALSLESLDILANSIGTMHPNYAGALNQISNIYEAKGDLAQSVQYAQQAREVYGKLVGKQHLYYAIVTNNLAELYLLLQQPTDAEPLLLEAYSIAQAALGEEYTHSLKIGNSLARLYILKGDTATAWARLDRNFRAAAGVSIRPLAPTAWLDSVQAKDFPSSVHAECAVQTLRLAYDLYPGTQVAHRQTIAEAALRILEKNRQRMTNEKDKLRLLALSNDWVLLHLDVLERATQQAQAFHVAEQNKSVLLMEASKSEEAHQMGDLPDSVFQKEKQLIAQYDQLQARLSEKRSEQEKDSLRNRLNALNIETIAFKEKIEQEYPRYAQWKYRQDLVDLAAVQARLDAETAILEYVVSDSTCYIFYIDAQRVAIERLDLPPQQLNIQTQRLQRALSDYEWIQQTPDSARLQYTETAHWFYQTFLAPVLAAARGIRHLVVIPDGELAHLPFETFLSKPAAAGMGYADLAYLMRDYRLSYNYSATLWKDNLEQKGRSNNGQLLAMAADYGRGVDSLVRSFRSFTDLQLRSHLSPIPAAQQEVASLSKRFAGLFIGDTSATEARFKAEAAQYGIIHLAMHGLLNHKNPLLSSLAFTENLDSADNNFLQAYEISKMRLNADLVVLSACETGYGKFEKGNGTASLARAFMYAGVPALVVSLWEVNDDATAKIMEYFYHELSDGKDKAESLRQAKLQYLSNAKGMAAHPAYWSAFVQMGDSRPVQLRLAGAWSRWWLIAVGVVGIGVLGMFRRRRQR